MPPTYNTSIDLSLVCFLSCLNIKTILLSERVVFCSLEFTRKMFSSSIKCVAPKTVIEIFQACFGARRDKRIIHFLKILHPLSEMIILLSMQRRIIFIAQGFWGICKWKTVKAYTISLFHCGLHACICV